MKHFFRSPYDRVRLLSFLGFVELLPRKERGHIEEKQNRLLEAEQNTQLTTRDCISASREVREIEREYPGGAWLNRHRTKRQKRRCDQNLRIHCTATVAALVRIIRRVLPKDDADGNICR